MATKRKIPATHPGEILRIEFLEPLDMSQSELARRISVDKRRVNEIIRGQRAVTVDTASRLAQLFNTSVEFWLNLQTRYNIDTSDEKIDQAKKDITPMI